MEFNDIEWLEDLDKYRKLHITGKPSLSEEKARLVNKVIEALSGEGLTYTNIYIILCLTEKTLQYKAKTATL